MLKFFNTLTRQLEEFKPINPQDVKIYSCGPTVYDSVHLGNLRAYVFVDLLKRYLVYSGYGVTHVTNITDVDDKTIRDSHKNNQTLAEFTARYTQQYLNDLQLLNILDPSNLVKATDHIPQMVDLIQKLLDGGLAYEKNGSVYFKISRFPRYGELAQLQKQDLQPNAEGRLNLDDDYEKQDVNDFALWKAWDPDDGDVFWETALGKGRPGWHIECSAMSMKYLGETFDIHAGGVDLIFPHHTNEIAQSEGVTHKKFVNYWLHNGHLLVEGQKMSKRLKNFFTLRDVIERGYDPLLLRVILIKTHYRPPANFTWEGLDEAKSIVTKITEFLIDLDHTQASGVGEDGIKNILGIFTKKFRAALDDDLNMSEAFATFYELMQQVEKKMNNLNQQEADQIKQAIFQVDQVLGFITEFYNKYCDRLATLLQNSDIQGLIRKRETFRQEKNFSMADEIRDDLARRGLGLKDTPLGYIPHLVNPF
jgi:cysteinyl-tRNA synthetase